MKPSLKTLTPTDELAHMLETLLIQEPLALLDRVVGHFTVLQTRAGLLLGLSGYMGALILSVLFGGAGA